MAKHMAEPVRKRKSPLVPILLVLVLLAAIGVGGFFAYRHFLVFDVTVNGQTLQAKRGDTVQTLIDTGVATPTPGNLLAIDGSVIEEGKGELCSVTIDGSEADTSAALAANATITIDDGADVTEESSTSEEVIPFETGEGDTSAASYYNGSIHLLSDGQDGKRVIRTGSISGKTIVEEETAPINAGYRVYTAKPADRVVALTFDDGPWPDTTNAILDILEKYDAKATFFTIGNQISSYSDAVKRAHDMGCQICTHSWDHAAGSGQGVNLTFMSADEQIEEIQKGYASIADVLGEEPGHVVRAPGGNFYGDIVNTLWPYVDVEVGWDVDTEDWRRPGVDAIVQAILSVQPGQVILMHDGGGDRSQTVEALATALPQLVDKGYSFVTIDELLEYGMPA
ncbi:MAG: polysaccharide deacetylase family protein [Atopobiaceae bacterium]|nr:polysaccharide deacetylase family protein [Atopobiaceae bacterium]